MFKGKGVRKQLIFESLELRQLLSANSWLAEPSDAYAETTGASPASESSDAEIWATLKTESELVSLQLPISLPASFSTTVTFAGEQYTLELEKHSVFGENTRFLVDDGLGNLVEVDRGVDRSYLGSVVGYPEFAATAVLTEFGLMANIIRPHDSTITIEPVLPDDSHVPGNGLHRIFIEEQAISHDHDGDGVADHAPEDHTDTTGGGHPPGCSCSACCTTAASEGPITVSPQLPVSGLSDGNLAAAGAASSTATLPPARVIQVREFEIGVEIGSAALLNNYSGSTIEQKIASATAEVAKIPANMDARYLHGAGIKHRLGTVIIRTGSDPFTVNSGTDKTGLSNFRNYWNSNPQEVGTSHDLAVYHVRSSPSGLAYVNKVGTSFRYALSASNGPSSWANGTLVHEFGHIWSLGHVPGSPSNTFYESKPRDNSGSNSAGGSDVFVSVMHGGGSHNIGRLSSGEANKVYNVAQNKTQFGDVVIPGPVKPFGNVDVVTVENDPLAIDVIANDYDSNNDVLDVDLLDTVSQKGGTISLSVGTGPGGRNEVIYTPPAGGFSGRDFFHYTVFDSTDRTDWGAVYVEFNGPTTVDMNQTSYNYDFGTPTSPVRGGWQGISPNTFGDISWSSNVVARDRGSSSTANEINRDFVQSSGPVTLEHKIANGLWSVVLNMGDDDYSHDNMSVTAEGILITNDVDSLAKSFPYVNTQGDSASPTNFEVLVTDGSLSLTFDDLGGSDVNWVLSRLSLNLIDSTPTVLSVNIDPVTGQTVVKNNTESEISFDAYTLYDNTESLTPETWFSLEDQGYDGGIWLEAGDLEFTMAELNTGSLTTLAPGELLYLGRTVNPQLVQTLSFEYFRSDTEEANRAFINFENPGIPLLPGDYNGDFEVNLADYTVWRDALGSELQSFSGADGNGNGIADQADYRLWKKNFGISAVATTLIDATQGNGEFAVDDANDVSLFGGGSDEATIDLGRDRAFRATGSAGRGISVSGWDIERVDYPGGNSAFGVDGTYGFATDPGIGPGQTGQAFANSGSVEVRSDTIVHNFVSGEQLELSYLLGTDTGTSVTVEATAQLVFDQGLPSERTHVFGVQSATGITTPLITQVYAVTEPASSVSLSFLLSGGTGVRTLLDRVELTSIVASTLSTISTVSSASTEQAKEPSTAVVTPPKDEPAAIESVPIVSQTAETATVSLLASFSLSATSPAMLSSVDDSDVAEEDKLPLDVSSVALLLLLEDSPAAKDIQPLQADVDEDQIDSAFEQLGLADAEHTGLQQLASDLAF